MKVVLPVLALLSAWLHVAAAEHGGFWTLILIEAALTAAVPFIVIRMAGEKEKV